MLRIRYYRWPDTPAFFLQSCEGKDTEWECLWKAYMDNAWITLGTRQYAVKGLLKHAQPEPDGLWRVDALVEDKGCLPNYWDE